MIGKTDIRGFRAVARFGFAGCVAATLVLSAPPALAAPAYDGGVATELESSGRLGRDLKSFYEAREFRPLWIRDNAIRPEATRLLALIESADLDGLDPDDYHPRALARALDRAQDGSPETLARAEALLSQSLVDYVQDVRRPPKTGMVYLDRELLPAVPAAKAVLDKAAAGSLATYIDQMQWANPIYAGLRKGLTAYRDADGEVDLSDPQARLIRLNMDRARALPAEMGRRYIIVDTLAGQLSMFENGRVQGTMRVVVGKPEEPTPMLAGMVRYAAVNPYWNVPPDLVRLRIAPKALEQGPSYVKSAGYQILSDWSADAQVVDPASVDWSAVASGAQELRVRQLPGPKNMMGRVKFMFPNDLGVYLHDTPAKELFRQSERQFSSGCVRVADAERLSRWLFGRKITGGSTPERHVNLPQPVPVYLTYFTAMPSAKGIAFRTDIYGRDGVKQAKRTTRLAGL